MVFVWLIPVFVSLLLLAAHFLREGSMIFLLMSLLAMPLLAVKRKWVAWFLRVLLILGAVEWCWTAWLLVNTRIEYGEPFLRLAIIMGAVASLTFFSAFVFNTRRLKNRYSKTQE